MGEKGNAGSSSLMDQAVDAGQEGAGFVAGAMGQGVAGVIATRTQDKLSDAGRGGEDEDPEPSH